MPITEEEYEQISDEIDSHDFFHLGDLAGAASIPGLLQKLDDLHNLSKRALDYRYSNDTQGALEAFFESVEEVRNRVMEAIESLEKIDDVLSKTEEVLSDKLYAEEFEDE
ncbi:hypothetical protein AB835_14760 [Candidatus Endobugula sertula]|uniref:Uncharacterized protein n=1 Tax=Candidatus Endobugula sertula TaxID=62101 RepID=A0A1D2QL94_9GAMM|nr:hypothetical protein AB835_14760 [Candidatus Endobugula sertula]